MRPIADSPESRAHVIGRETRESCMVHGACNVERVAARRIPVDPGGARSVPGFAAAGAKACAVLCAVRVSWRVSGTC